MTCGKGAQTAPCPPRSDSVRAAGRSLQSIRHRLAGLLAICLSCAVSASSQVETGTIVGTVRDPSDAALPGVRVEIRSVATGVMMTVATNETGRYQSPPLKPDEYEISTTVQGFKSSRAALRVEVNQRVGLDFRLEPGAVTEAVTSV